MKKFNIILSSVVLAVIIGISGFNFEAISAPASAPVKKAVTTTKTTTQKPAAQTTTTPTYSYMPVKSLDLVAHPNVYLNKRVKIQAKFDKFSSLGLDYKPAMRSSEKYITFLIRRDDAVNDIPLSELKNFMKREMAEKYIELETNDVIEYSGLVFSNALGDVWLEVENFKIISSKAKKTTK